MVAQAKYHSSFQLTHMSCESQSIKSAVLYTCVFMLRPPPVAMNSSFPQDSFIIVLSVPSVKIETMYNVLHNIRNVGYHN